MAIAAGRALRALALAGFALILVACESKVSQKNFERIRPGMTISEVQAILGEPAESNSVGVGPLSGTAAVWRNEKASIDIKFVNGKVQIKNFSKQ
jgi:hypothetical protein